jgi:hypothetical protein
MMLPAVAAALGAVAIPALAQADLPLSAIEADGSEAGDSTDSLRTYIYRVHDEDSADVTDEVTRQIRLLPSGEMRVNVEWESTVDSTGGTLEHLLDGAWETLRWKVTNPHEGTDYVGTRNGNTLVIEGTHHGEPVSKEIEIDEKPFFSNPSLGLEGFVRSGEEKMEFRTLRPDNLSEYKMKAQVKEVENITVNGEEIEAVRVKWGLTGLKAMFYSQTLWFRKADGVLLRTKSSRGRYTELFSEH